MMYHAAFPAHPIDGDPALAAPRSDEPAAAVLGNAPASHPATHGEAIGGATVPAPRASVTTPDRDGTDRRVVAGDERDDEARLARQLAEILATPPRRSLSQPPAGRRAADDAVDAEDVDDDAVTTLVTARRYATALHCAAAPAQARRDDGDRAESVASDADTDEADDGPHAATGNRSAASRWLQAARRRRTMSKLGAAVSWLATVGIGLVIVWVAASVVFGDVGLIKAVHDTTQRPF